MRSKQETESGGNGTREVAVGRKPSGDRRRPIHRMACAITLQSLLSNAFGVLQIAALCVALSLLLPRSVLAQPKTPPAAEKPIREIYVPFDDLNVLLESKTQRVFMTRQQYDELLAKAKLTPSDRAPRGAAVLAADYNMTLEEGRALLTGTLHIDVLEDGLHALPLDLAGVGVRSATLDGKPAPIALNAQRKPMLLVEGKGRHTLTLEMVAPLETAAAQQSLGIQIPTPAAARMKMTVPGNVEIRSGASVLKREVAADQSHTTFELLPQRGQISLVMSLNNRLLRQQRVVVARSVIVDEVTEAYERLHSTVSLAVLHGAVDSFRFVVPDGFEVTDVVTPLLARWLVEDADGKRVLDVKLREATTDTVVLTVAAIRTPARLDQWTLPHLEPLDVEGHVSVVGLLVEDRLKPEAIEQQGLIPIDNAVLAAALPATVFEAEAGAPQIRSAVAYYAPQSAYELKARFDKPPARLRVTSNLLLLLDDGGQQVRGGFALLPEAEKLFAIDFTAPPGWHVTEATLADDTRLPIEEFAAGDSGSRVHVRLPNGIAPGQPQSVYFHAVSTPAGWLGEWPDRPVAFPVFAVAGADRDVGAVAIEALDDLVVRPDKLTGLTPLDENEKAKYGLEGVPTSLAYRYEAPAYAASLIASRTAPRMTARTHSFLQINADSLTAHYELAYDVQDARTRRLSLRLPASTPAEVAIRGLDGVEVKESSSEVLGSQRRWTVLLAERQSGTIRLAVDFQQRLETPEPKGFVLPLVSADGVSYQSGMVAVEGSAELDVEITKHPRRADIGELVDADYQVGRRLLGAFGYPGDSAEVTVDVFRRPGYGLPSAIVQRAELVSLVSTNQRSQTAARYLLRTKAQFLEVELPANSTLWSTYLDQKPTAPQRDGNSLLLSLPATTELALRDLQIVYEAPIDTVRLRGRIDMPAPKLLLREQRGAAATEVPVADLAWHLHLPSGYRVVQSGGTVFTDQLAMREMPVWPVARVLYRLAGGVFVDNGMGLVPSSRATRYYLYDSSQSMTTSDAEHYRGYDTRRSSSGEVTAGRDLESAPQAVELDEFGAMTEPSDMPFAPGEGRPATPPLVPPEPKPDQEFTPLPVTSPQPTTTAATPSDVGKDQTVQLGKYWALEGVRSLQIELQQQAAGEQVEFQSLGVDPRLNATLVDERRLDSLAWGVALLIGLAGFVLTSRPVKTKFVFVVSVMAAALLLPLVTGWVHELGRTCDLAFYAACLLVPYYLAAAVLKWLGCKVHSLATRRRTAPSAAAAVTAALLIVAMFVPAANAQPPALPEFRDFFPPLVPVTVPADAVIIPYDVKDEQGLQKAEKLLVPYDTYVELWNRAYPDKKLLDKPPPAQYALAGAAFSAELSGDEYLLVTGSVDIDVYVDEAVTIPLPLEGGVLAQATLDGQPARLQIVQLGQAPNAGPQPAQQAQAQQMKGQQRAEPPPGTFVVLHASGKGRKRLEVAVRLHLERQGGWRIAEGRVPAAPVTSLTLSAADAQTEVRLRGLHDRLSYETKQPNQRIETALGADGLLSVQWRPKVAEAEVDRSLTAQSVAMLDVQEDGLRLVWRLTLEFRRSRRESFTVTVPGNYLVEKVEGNNVRGWQLPLGEGPRPLEITLLKQAADQESFTIHMVRRGAVGQGALAQFDAPVVNVADAALHQGQLTVRRSPLLDLQTMNVAGLSRTDAPAEATNMSDSADESPLGLRPYQSYLFVTPAYTMQLSAAPVAANVAADVQTLLKIAERETRLESRINFRAQDRPVYRVRMYLPEGLELEPVFAAGLSEWAVTDDNGRKLLSIYYAAGQQNQFSVLLNGTIAKDPAADSVALPKLEVLDVSRQQGDIVVQVDPAVDVRAEQLVGCESVLLSRVQAWLDEGQRGLARLVLNYRTPQHSAVLKTSPRKPDVSGYTISNVKVTRHAILETVFVHLTIRNAGIRELSFVLPASMKDARVKAPMLRQKTITPVNQQPDSPVRVRLELQDELMGEYRVIVEQDRLLTSGEHPVPIPVVESARIDQRFVSLENEGADELLVKQQQGVEPLGRQQSQWQKLANIFGERITTAYIVSEGATSPTLTFATKERTTVEVAGARIELGETLLVLDSNGAYRAEQTYYVDNRTEQFLVVQLPAGARLWTTLVAGEPVKPTEVPGGKTPGQVRIPLVKTAAGDLDFRVSLKYGGQITSPGRLQTIDFPLVRTVGIKVELSQVRLLLPESYRWFNFGGTMGLVEDELDFAAGFLTYQTKKMEQLAEVARGDSYFARARAFNNLKQIGLAVHDYRSNYESNTRNEQLQRSLDANTVAIVEAERVIQAEEEKAARQVEVFDNRDRLNELWNAQDNGRARNIVNDIGGNFKYVPQQTPPASPEGQQFNPQWLEQNKLQSEFQVDGTVTGERVSGPATRTATQPGQQEGGKRSVQLDQSYNQPMPQGQPFNPTVASGKNKEALSELAGEKQAAAMEQSRGKGQGDYLDQANRYQQRLEQQQQGQQLDGFNQSGLGGGGFGMQPGLQTRGALVDQSRLHGNSEGLFAGERTVNGLAQFGGDGEIATVSLASLDVALPNRGVEFLFTTPGGEINITAQTVGNTTIDRLVHIASVAGAALIVLVLYVLLRGVNPALLTNWIAGLLYLSGGLFSICTGIFPVVGLIAALTGIVLLLSYFITLLTRRFRRPQPSAATT
jgi:hypothetical protein